MHLALLTQLRTLKAVPGLLFRELPVGISNLAGLRELDLGWKRGHAFSRLTEFPEGIRALSLLQVLNLKGCTRLSELPLGIFDLTLLRVLNLSLCMSLTFIPEQLSHLVLLEALDVSGCSVMTALPDSISSLVALKELHLLACKALLGLPDSVSRLSALTILRLSRSPLTGMPVGIGGMRSLKHLIAVIASS